MVSNANVHSPLLVPSDRIYHKINLSIEKAPLKSSTLPPLPPLPHSGQGRPLII